MTGATFPDSMSSLRTIRSSWFSLLINVPAHPGQHLAKRFAYRFSLSGSPRRSLVSPCVSSPMAKYASCSRAQASQKGIPWISTTA
jgi:hypothetical protein